MMRARPLIVAIFLLMQGGAAHAVQPDEILNDPKLETRARALSRELRCMVCQNQSIDDSDAPLARDLRLLVRERLQSGDTDREVLDYLVTRYGQFVLLRPRLQWQTLALWLLPPLVLVLGALMVWHGARGRRRAAASRGAEAALSPAERDRLARLLAAPPAAGPDAESAQITKD